MQNTEISQNFLAWKFCGNTQFLQSFERFPRQEITWNYGILLSVKSCYFEEKYDYFFPNNPKIERFYFLPEIHEKLHDVPEWPVISNSG